MHLRNIDRYSADSLSLSRPTGGRISTDSRPTVDRHSTACRSTIDRLSIDYRSTIDRLSIDYRPLYRSTVDRYSGRHSGRHYVAITYSKHDPKNSRLPLQHRELLEMLVQSHFTSRLPLTICSLPSLSNILVQTRLQLRSGCTGVIQVNTASRRRLGHSIFYPHPPYGRHYSDRPLPLKF